MTFHIFLFKKVGEMFFTGLFWQRKESIEVRISIFDLCGRLLSLQDGQGRGRESIIDPIVVPLASSCVNASGSGHEFATSSM